MRSHDSSGFLLTLASRQAWSPLRVPSVLTLCLLKATLFGCLVAQGAGGGGDGDGGTGGWGGRVTGFTREPDLVNAPNAEQCPVLMDGRV